MLRDYQIEAYQKTTAAIAAGKKSPLIVMAPGCGKTQTFLHFIDQAFKQGWCKRALVLAHTKDLVTQPIERIPSFFPDLVGKYGVVMNTNNDLDKPLIFGSRDTLKNWKRLGQVLAFGKFDFLVIDECHRRNNEAASYEFIEEKLLEANPNLIKLGVTATPKERHGNVWDCVPFKLPFDKAIDNGILCPVSFFQVKTGISLAGVKVVNGEFSKEGIVSVYETSNSFDLVVETHKKHTPDRQGIAFVRSVEGAARLAEKFNEAGFKAVSVDASTAKEERDDISKRFMAGAIQMICNVGVYTEGKDLPPISVVHMVVPTKSATRFAQAAGRGFRKHPGKENCIVFEYVPIENDLDLAFGGDLLGLPVSREAIASKDEDDDDGLSGFTYDGKVKYLHGNPAEIITVQIDRLKKSKNHWIGERDDWLILPVGVCQDNVDRTYVLTPPSQEEHSIYAIRRFTNNMGEKKVLVDRVAGKSYSDLMEWAEERATNYGKNQINAKAAHWRLGPVTENQKKWKGIVAKANNAGEAADAITRHLALTAIKNSGVQVERKAV